MKPQRIISTIDSHTAGECTRVITEGVPSIPGNTMAEKQRYFKENLDDVRKALMLEPRGNKDLVGAVLTEPVSENGDVGVLFIDALGFEAMCGHGIIGLVTTLIDTGQIKAQKPVTEVNVDTLSGTVTARAVVDEDGDVTEVSFQNVPSFVYMPEARVRFDGNAVATDIVFGGNFFAILPASRLGLELSSANINTLTSRGIAFRDAAKEQLELRHPIESNITNLHGVELYGPSSTPGVHGQNIMVFAQNAYDRSPCGTGTSARLALMYSRGEIGVGEEFVYQSIIGTV
ncbi:MAG: proline racemase family protein, partial [Dehalococcoidia bacterium]